MITMTVGQRVVTTATIDIYPLGVWPIGTTGTVVQTDTVNGQMLAAVKLDQHFASLNAWDNCLQVWETQTEDNGNTDAVMASFEEQSQ